MATIAVDKSKRSISIRTIDKPARAEEIKPPPSMPDPGPPSAKCPEPQQRREQAPADARRRRPAAKRVQSR